MSIFSSDFSTLLLACEFAPAEEATPFLVAADWCDEHDLGKWAYALRWCGGRKRRPFKRTDVRRRPWQWVADKNRYSSLSRSEARARSAAILPLSVWSAIPGDPTTADTRDYATFRDATAAIVDATSKLRADVAVPDLPPVVVKPAAVKLVTCRECGIARNEITAYCFVCKATEVKG